MKSSHVKHHKKKSSFFWPVVILCGILAIGLFVILGEEDENDAVSSVNAESSSRGSITSVGMGTQTYTGSYRANQATCSVTITMVTSDYDQGRDSAKTTATRTENCVPDPPPPSGGGK